MNTDAPANTARREKGPVRLELSYSTCIQNTTTEGVPQREGEGVHLLLAIFVTAPVFQFDTSELNAAALLNTARREKGATKKRKTNPPQTQQKGTVSKHINKK